MNTVIIAIVMGIMYWWCRGMILSYFGFLFISSPVTVGLVAGLLMGQPMQGYAQPHDVNVAPAAFQPFATDVNPISQKENIELIKDVPLEVTVELGRTTKSIKDILEFAPGTIVELNKIAGESVDVLVNGKYVAKGEVVVIEESFGVRITEIIK